MSERLQEIKNNAIHKKIHDFFTEIPYEDFEWLIEQAEQLEKVNRYQRIYIVWNNTEETKEIVLVTHNREKALSYIGQKGYAISGHTPED